MSLLRQETALFRYEWGFYGFLILQVDIGFCDSVLCGTLKVLMVVFVLKSAGLKRFFKLAIIFLLLELEYITWIGRYFFVCFDEFMLGSTA